MNHHEQTNFSQRTKNSLDLRPLGELLALWPVRNKDLSKEFLAATLCTELERQSRVGASEEASEIKEARKLLLQDRLGECALEDVEAQSLLVAAQNYVRGHTTRGLANEERAREGFTILSDHDALQLLLRAIEKAPLSSSARGKLRREQKIMAQATRTLERNLMAFYAVSLMANDYCLTWNVEENGVLSRVAYLGCKDLEVVWAERNRKSEPLPEATVDCLDENLLTARFGGKLKGSVLRRIDTHVADCRRCSGLLDELTKSFIRTPVSLPKAPVEFLPGPLRKIERPQGWKRLKEKLDHVIEKLIDFVVPRPFLQPALLRGADHVAEVDTLDELERSEVLVETDEFQAVLFWRHDTIWLSLLSDNLRSLRSLAITDVKTKRRVRMKLADEKKGEKLYSLGPAVSLLGKTLRFTLRFKQQLYRNQVRIRSE